ncbi:MAG: response regulator [Gemmatimonadota bacterium]|nr:response regulator [Gemmatimonadota bacterium]MDH5760399.1 response regulator [Gemmatimonadota bacterium]
MSGLGSVLVVESTPEIQYFIEAVLRETGREVVIAPSADEARALIESGATVDLALLALLLADRDGRAVLREFREDPRTAHLPVVMMACSPDPGLRTECFSLGATAFLEKPLDAESLLAEVRFRLHRVDEAEGDSHRDPRTGLLNRAGILAALSALDPDEEATVAVLELDAFRSVSDRFGWATAARILESVAVGLGEAASDDTEVGSWSGAEFAILFPGRAAAAALPDVERLLELIRASPVPGPDGEDFHITASVGVTDRSGLQAIGETDLLAGAQKGLSAARRNGGNQWVCTGTDHPEPEPLQVLVAEDDEITATLLIHRLTREGMGVRHFSNGRDAYAAALEFRPALAILDVKMPGMDGFELLQRLRKSPNYSRTPIILLTSMGSEADIVRGFDLGADDYILKPFSPTELMARVRRLLGSRAVGGKA